VRGFGLYIGMPGRRRRAEIQRYGNSERLSEKLADFHRHRRSPQAGSRHRRPSVHRIPADVRRRRYGATRRDAWRRFVYGCPSVQPFITPNRCRTLFV